jgi:hypothetical protein
MVFSMQSLSLNVDDKSNPSKHWLSTQDSSQDSQYNFQGIQSIEPVSCGDLLISYRFGKASHVVVSICFTLFPLT